MYARKLSTFSECLIKQVDKMKKYLNKEAVLDIESEIALKSTPSKPSHIPVLSGKTDPAKEILSTSRCARWAEHPATKIARWSKSLKVLTKREKLRQKKLQEEVTKKKVSKIPLLVGLKAHIKKAKGVKEDVQALPPRTPGTPLPPIQKSSGFSVYPVLPGIKDRKKSKTNKKSGKKRGERDSRFAVKNIYSGKDCCQY